jgi:putative ABC transport system permease protein
MKLYQIVLKDITRRKKRMLYASLGVVIGVATIGETNIYGQLEKYGANLVVMPAISDINVGLGGLSLGTLAVGENYIYEDNLPEVRQITDGMIREALGIEDEGDIATIAPRLVKGTSVIVVGVDPQQERQLKTWWRIREGEYLENADQALVGATAAELLELNVGDKIAPNGREVIIAGILEETGSEEDYQVFLHIETAQEAFDKEGLVSSIDVRALCSACPTSNIAGSINGNIPGVRAVAVKQIAETEMGMMERVSRFLLALAGITLAVGCFGVVSSRKNKGHRHNESSGRITQSNNKGFSLRGRYRWDSGRLPWVCSRDCTGIHNRATDFWGRSCYLCSPVFPSCVGSGYLYCGHSHRLSRVPCLQNQDC